MVKMVLNVYGAVTTGYIEITEECSELAHEVLFQHAEYRHKHEKIMVNTCIFKHF